MFQDIVYTLYILFINFWVLYFSDFIPINTETNISQLTRTLGDIFTAGIVSDVELAPWFLATLIAKLKSVVCNLSPLVATEFYLPAPPLFCPQPGEIETVGYFVSTRRSRNDGLFCCAK
ncbi:hypothetical protein DPMN_157254 [Dreissena polymorpha]|uniref:Uncharacterized protein n=1 Tax=Dreissena polymorpha TaxID=45954 RepID=A0A9D4IKW9_DREPO|nr:hypothetical protein DPMN_157254 [Dreissena polymorpha]